jgi:hypothetical protein
MTTRSSAGTIRGRGAKPIGTLAVSTSSFATPAACQLPMDKSKLLINLLDYVLEQDKEIDLRGFRLRGDNDLITTADELRGMPGIDIKVEGDQVSLGVAWLEVKAPLPIGNPKEASHVAIRANHEGPRRSSSETALCDRIPARHEVSLVNPDQGNGLPSSHRA